MSAQIPGIPKIHSFLARDVTHRLALVCFESVTKEYEGGVPQRKNGSLAYAVVICATGEVLGHDSWMGGLEGIDTVDIAGLDFTEWDDWPSKLVMIENRKLLAGPLAWFLTPSYSPAREAAKLLAPACRKFSDYDLQQYRGGKVIAYVPIVDEDILWSSVKAEGHNVPVELA